MGEKQLERLPNPDDQCLCGKHLAYKHCCQRALLIRRKTPSGMCTEIIGGVEVYRPSPQSNSAIRFKAEPELRKFFKPGKYTKAEEVRDILFKQVENFGDLFDSLIPKLASRDLLEFLLWQYDLAAKLDRLHLDGSLRGEAHKQWSLIGPTHMRTLKYIAERITMLAPEDISQRAMPSIAALDEAFICAEELIDYCSSADLSRLFPDSTIVIIQEEGKKTYSDHSINDSRCPSGNEFHKRIVNDVEARQTLFKNSSFSRNIKNYGELDSALLSSIGLTYSEAINILSRMKDGCTAAPDDPMGTKFVLREGLISNGARITGKPADSIDKLVAGFSLTQQALLARANGDTDYWNPQFEERAYRKAFFSMPHKLGVHLAFSNQMFAEALTFLHEEISFGKFPKLWRSAEVDKAIGKIVVARGKWFENEVHGALKSIKIEGVCSRTSIGTGNKTLGLCGEFDYIGWSQANSALVLLETKMLQPSTEAKVWGNQLKLFLEDSKKEEAFVSKLKRKAEWVVQNSGAIIEALASEGIEIRDSPSKLLAAFVTYVPFALNLRIKDFPCVALSEFLTDYGKKTTWSRKKGIYSI